MRVIIASSALCFSSDVDSDSTRYSRTAEFPDLAGNSGRGCGCRGSCRHCSRSACSVPLEKEEKKKGKPKSSECTLCWDSRDHVGVFPMQQVQPLAMDRGGASEGATDQEDSSDTSDEFVISRTKSLEVLVPPG